MQLIEGSPDLKVGLPNEGNGVGDGGWGGNVAVAVGGTGVGGTGVGGIGVGGTAVALGSAGGDCGGF